MPDKECNPTEPCDHLVDCRKKVEHRLDIGANRFDDLCDKLDLVLERQDEMAADMLKMTEIITAWNNAKGFVSTLGTISKVFRWLVITAGAVGAVWYFITHGGAPK